MQIEGGGRTGGLDPPGNYKKVGFHSNTGPDPLKITKLPIQHSMLGHQLPASKMPFKWHFPGRPFMAHLSWYLDLSSPHQTKKKVKVGPPLTKLPESAHDHGFGFTSQSTAMVMPRWSVNLTTLFPGQT